MSVNFPRMFTIRQNLPRSAPIDIPYLRTNQLAQKFAYRITPGARIAIAVGSRGITNLQQIVSLTVDWLKSEGQTPFIVPPWEVTEARRRKGRQAFWRITESLRSRWSSLKGLHGREGAGAHRRWGGWCISAPSPQCRRNPVGESRQTAHGLFRNDW